ncbi:hypothetical protein [Lentilactobacillus laojiaonis]|uniref:hypothetical protein n=1 Tax=Lentilactobacillus laojiaonis TaxID=2883998 RepID=UPI001D0A0A67|nr:hypothetical protein [Lentilactobacillus laojiaonis]UDM31993.1 hypothetical protein LHL71_05560 [Lentilactobacillus laojiaonis]
MRIKNAIPIITMIGNTNHLINKNPKIIKIIIGKILKVDPNILIKNIIIKMNNKVMINSILLLLL